jgi:predicted DCC family thiol-disulfide oxidoreductase YuxK
MFLGLPTASLTLTNLFSAPFHFSVPCYQRPYSWTTAEAGQLLDDLLGASGIGGVAGAEEPDYFLGTIILIDGTGGDLPKARDRDPRLFEIIDGQQRLVTLAIAAAVLRDLGTERWRWGARNRLDQLIAADSTATKLHGVKFRVEVSAREQAFLETYVQMRGGCLTMPVEETTTEAEDRLLKVRDHFIRELSSLDEGDRRRLSDYICDQCHFVVVLTRDIDRAHRLFTVLNERGRALQRNDILKAELLKNIPDARQAAALEKWDAAAQLLGAKFEPFFSHVFSIYGRGDTKIIAGVRRTINEVGGPEAFLNEVVGPLSKAYDTVLRAADVNLNIDPDARRHLVYLGRLPEGDWVPAAMLAVHQYADDPERASLLLREIDRVVHLLRVLCLGAGKRVRRLGNIVAHIKSRAPVKPGEGPFQLSRDEVRNIGYHLRTMYRRDAQVCKQLLLRLNDELTRSTTVLDPKDYSVEHVLPQRPGATSEWRRWFADAEEREACTESLGNLVAVTQKQNDRARNQEFARKREIYRGTDDDPPVLAITRDVFDTSVWRAAEIRAREAKLLDLMREIWGIEIAAMPGALNNDVA